MNKEGSRINIYSNSVGGVLSGELNVITSFLPKVYKSYLRAKFTSLRYGLVMVPLKGYFNQKDYSYQWLMRDSGRVFKVYRPERRVPNNVNLILENGDIMLKGLGVFDPISFKQFNF